MNSGTAEHEQNGVTIPKPAAATVPTAAFRPASALRTRSGDTNERMKETRVTMPGEQQQDLGHVVEEERDRLADLGRRVEPEDVEGEPGRERQRQEPGDDPERRPDEDGQPERHVDAADREGGHRSTSASAASAAAVAASSRS